MFISNDEKKYLFNQIKNLQNSVSDMGSEILYLKGRVKALNMTVSIIQQIVEANKVKPKPKKVLTPEQKIRQREYMRKYMAKKKAQKALEQK